MATWRAKITEEMRAHGDTWASVESVVTSAAPAADALNRVFYDGFGARVPEGHPFCVWTKDRVYFPIEFDGAENVKSVSRNPDGKVVEFS